MNNQIERCSFKNKDEAQKLLTDSRIQIDEIDNELFDLIYKRVALAKDIVLSKKYLNMPIYDKKREDVIFNKIEKLASEKGLDAEIMGQIMNMLTILSKKEQEKILRRVDDGKY